MHVKECFVARDETRKQEGINGEDKVLLSVYALPLPHPALR